MHELTIIHKNGRAYVDSRDVAGAIGKRHDHLLRDIGKYRTIMLGPTAPNFGASDFFLESSYVDNSGRTLPCYLLSKMGCELVANKLTGEKGVLFTAAYVAKFNIMEADEIGRLKNECAQLEARLAGLEPGPPASPPMPPPRLGEFNACARIVARALRDGGAPPGQLVKFLKNLYGPLGIAVAEDDVPGGAPQMYTASQVAKKLGIYSTNGRPHHQAAACILNENLFIGNDHKSVTAEDCGGHAVARTLYDGHAVQSVRDWLLEYGYPDEIYGFARTYRVLYR